MLPRPECKCGCGGLVAPGRKVYAIPQCHGSWRNKVHKHREIRTVLFERDGGVCSMCGCNTMQMRSEHIERLHARFPGQIPVIMDELHPEIRPPGFPSLRNSWWQADHKTPLVEGGTSNLDDYQSLCCPCHKIETRSLQCRRAEARRAGGTLSLSIG